MPKKTVISKPAELTEPTEGKTPAPLHPEYPAFLAALKERVLRARVTAARAVNQELVLLYWDIGCGIVEKQRQVGWGESVVERLAADLQAEFPDVRGFSRFNLWRMRQFYLELLSPEFLAQAVPELKKAPGRFLPEITRPVLSGDQDRKIQQPVPTGRSRSEQLTATAFANWRDESIGTYSPAVRICYVAHRPRCFRRSYFPNLQPSFVIFVHFRGHSVFDPGCDGDNFPICQ